jgi:branched-chain amino acid transport system ATP-binding protein
VTILETRVLTKHFGHLTAVDEMNLRVTSGERHALIGPNGAGKTTIFHIISGRISPDSGSVLFQGTEITGMHPHEIARLGIARSFQITNIFPDLPVRENIRLAVQARHGSRKTRWRGRSILAETAKIASGYLEQLNLTAMADMPAGTLSYGDQRRLEIGLTLAMEPVLILLDEPTAGMSHAEAHDIVELLRQIPRSVTLLLIEHDIDVVFSLSDRITVMRSGRLLAEGTPSEVERNKQVQEAYFGGEADRGA